MTVKVAADVLAKVAAADAKDRQIAFDLAFLKTAEAEFGLTYDEACNLRADFAKECQSK